MIRVFVIVSLSAVILAALANAYVDRVLGELYESLL
jgi:hypothetical protein